ncbi:unnamed protein product [Oncorhynchus mykiss]|uniref:Uncharacterized protein n=1 Tax=Oncorhynchus mykiss TaxID=8022 RepID=A0A060ZAA5_ONCMY|nr:unnamed protein product [Oncorhynchus mykiss]
MGCHCLEGYFCVTVLYLHSKGYNFIILYDSIDSFHIQYIFYPAVHVPMEEEDQEEMKTDGSDNMLKRVFNIVKFSWVLFLAMLDSFTAWINSMCQEHLDISTVLRIERCMLTHEVNKGNKPSRESIHVYYRKQMCKAASIESGLERTEEETCQDCIPHKAESCACLESQESVASHDSLSR